MSQLQFKANYKSPGNMSYGTELFIEEYYATEKASPLETQNRKISQSDMANEPIIISHTAKMFQWC